jgi:uncharacterized repeat protein (TIGR01451 family)
MERYGRHYIFQNKWLALILACVMSFSSVFQVAASAAMEISSPDLKIQSGNQELLDEAVVETNKIMSVNFSGGFSGEREENTRYEARLYIGDMKTETFDNITGGGKVIGAEYIADGIKYTVKQDANTGEKYIHIEKYDTVNNKTVDWEDGDTFKASLNVHFDASAENGAKWPFTLKFVKVTTTPDGTKTEKEMTGANKSISVKAKSEAQINNTKSADVQSLTLGEVNGQTTLGRDIKYTVSAYSGSELDTKNRRFGIGEAPIKSYTVTDTLSFREFEGNVYIPAGDNAEQAIRNALTAPAGVNYSITDIVRTEEKITGFTFTYTVDNDKYNSADGTCTEQIQDTQYVFTLEGSSVTVADGFKDTDANKKITNSVSTTAQTIHNVSVPVQQDSADTTVRRPKDASYAGANKSVADVSDQYGTWNSWDSNAYVVEGDYVLYKIEFTNSGETPITGATITDTLPAGLTAAKDITGDNYRNVLGKFMNQDLYNSLIKSSNYNGPWVTSGTATASVSGQTVTFSNVSVNAGETFEAYILAKVTGNVEDKTTRTNIVTINGEDYTASINQQPRKANISVSKSVENTTEGSDAKGTANYKSDANETVRYTIKVSNNGTADAKGVTLKDIFPSDWIETNHDRISDKTYTTDDVSSTDTEEDKKTTTTYIWDNLTVPAGESVIVTIDGKIKNGVKDDTIINTAQTVYNGETKEANAELTRIDPAQYVEVNKSTESTSANPGGEIEYTINVDTNDAKFDASQPLKIVDEIPNGLEYVRSEVTEEGGLKRYTAQGSGTEVSGNYVRWSFIGEGTAVIKVTFKVKDNFIGSISNTAYAVGGNGSTGTSTAGKVEVFPQSSTLAVEKSADIIRNGQNAGTIAAGATGEIQKGDELLFHINVTNNGTEPVTQFILSDVLDGYYLAHDNIFYTVDMDIDTANSTASGLNNDSCYLNNQNQSGSYEWINEDSTYERVMKGGTTTFVFTNDTTRGNNNSVYSNAGFSIGAGQHIALTYKVKTAEQSFTKGSNTVKINNSAESKVSYSVAAPGESPAPENQSKLTIEKTVSDKYYGSNLVDEIIVTESDGVGGKEFYYTVTVKNESYTPYTASDAAIVDFLPEGWGLKVQSSGNVWSSYTNLIKSVRLADKYSTSESGWITNEEAYSKYNAQYKDQYGYPENVLAIHLTDGTTPLTIPAHGFISVTYAVKAKAEEVSKIQSEINSNSPTFDFTPCTLTNTAYFTGDTSFINIDGSSVKTIFDNATVKVRAQSVHPGITKTAYAYFPVANAIQEGKNGAMPGDCLIWKIKIENAGDSTNGRAMSNYTVTDTLPNGYQYVTDQTYTNSNGTKYPDNLNNEFKSGKMIKHKANKSTEELDYLAPTEVSKTVTWNFDDSKYTLEPGEYLEFLVITEPETNEYKSGVYYNNAKLTVEGKLYEDTISAGVAGGGGVTDGDSFSINSVVTSSQMSVKGTNGTAVGGTATNSVSGIGGETVTYTMQVTNESQSEEGITNLTIINRLPYEGDSGVLTSGARNSEFEVTYKDALSVYYIDGSGNRTDLSEENYVVTTYSSDEEKTFTEESSDWTSAATEDGWKTGYDDSTKLVRIQFNKFTLPAGATVYAEYSAQLPYASSEMDMTAWNSFAYRYDEEGGGAGIAKNMAGEPAAVGVSLSQTDTQMGSIRVKKAWVSSSTEKKTFYFAVYDNACDEGGQRVGEVQSISLSAGGGTARPVSAEITFDNLPYVAIGTEKTYYIYETDENGVPIKQDESLGYNMYLGYYRSSDKVKWEDGSEDGDGNILVTGTDKSDSSKKYEMTKIAEGNYSHWTKGLSATKQSNTAQFSNIDMNPEPTQEPVQETTVDIMGPYYADVPVSAETNSQLDTGKKVGDSHVEQDGINYTYINGEKFTGLSQYGGEQGHTIATGFMAKITAGTGGETINSISWEIKSSKIIEETDPRASSEPDGVYVKLPVYTASPETIEEIGADESESYEVIYVNDFPADIFVDEAFDQEVSLGAEDEIEDLGGDPNYMDETERIDAVAQNLGFDPDSVLYDENGQAFFIINQDIELYANDGNGKEGTLNAGALPDGEYQNFINNGVHMISKYQDTADGKYYAIFKLVRSKGGEQWKNNQLKWTINESLGIKISLEAGASIHFGIILDELYDRNATAQFEYNKEGITTSDDFKKEREKIKEDTDQVKVPGHNEFKK